MTTLGIRPVEPLRSCPDGVYQDETVVVRRVAYGPRISLSMTPAGRVLMECRLSEDELHDQLAELVEAQFSGNVTADASVFERLMTGLVLTARPDSHDAWALYYRNTLARAADPDSTGYPEIYRRALQVLAPYSSVLDLGCSMGFLSLLLSAHGKAVTACDIEPGAADLLRSMAREFRLPVGILTADARKLELPDRAVDAVVLLHVLEHVSEFDAEMIVAEALRVARHRVVIAVPYELSATEAYGHVRTMRETDLVSLGRASGWIFDVTELHGGFLVMDRRT